MALNTSGRKVFWKPEEINCLHTAVLHTLRYNPKMDIKEAFIASQYHLDEPRRKSNAGLNAYISEGLRNGKFEELMLEAKKGVKTIPVRAAVDAGVEVKSTDKVLAVSSKSISSGLYDIGSMLAKDMVGHIMDGFANTFRSELASKVNTEIGGSVSGMVKNTVHEERLPVAIQTNGVESCPSVLVILPVRISKITQHKLNTEFGGIFKLSFRSIDYMTNSTFKHLLEHAGKILMMDGEYEEAKKRSVLSTPNSKLIPSGVSISDALTELYASL